MNSGRFTRVNQADNSSPPKTSPPSYVIGLTIVNVVCAAAAAGVAVASLVEARKDFPSDQSTFDHVNDRLDTLHAGLEVAVHPTCRLVYTDDDDQLSESQMQEWIKNTSWTVGVTHYSQVRRACVCEGSDDHDPMHAEKGTTPAWVAPADLVFLVQEGIMEGTSLPPDFVSKYGGDFSPSRHVKVCIDQASLAHLWEYDGETHCHEKNGDGSVARILTGWDGDLFCGTTTQPWVTYYTNTTPFSEYDGCDASKIMDWKAVHNFPAGYAQSYSYDGVNFYVLGIGIFEPLTATTCQPSWGNWTSQSNIYEFASGWLDQTSPDEDPAPILEWLHFTSDSTKPTVPTQTEPAGCNGDCRGMLINADIYGASAYLVVRNYADCLNTTESPYTYNNLQSCWPYTWIVVSTSQGSSWPGLVKFLYGSQDRYFVKSPNFNLTMQDTSNLPNTDLSSMIEKLHEPVESCDVTSATFEMRADGDPYTATDGSAIRKMIQYIYGSNWPKPTCPVYPSPCLTFPEAITCLFYEHLWFFSPTKWKFKLESTLSDCTYEYECIAITSTSNLWFVWSLHKDTYYVMGPPDPVCGGISPPNTYVISSNLHDEYDTLMKIAVSGPDFSPIYNTGPCPSDD